MNNFTDKTIKNLWNKFFASKGYKLDGGASLIPVNDATVLFTTAGMHPLVPYLLGETHPLGKKIMNTQKCLRTTDIDEVGDNRHCTFFEMLGSWTLGQCDKHEMIKNSFEFLTSNQYLGLDKSKLAVSVFAGDEHAPKDTVSHDAWIECGLTESQIFYLPKNNNWWALNGGVGPCGPDTEMFIDTGKPKCCDTCSPACDCGKYVEIWNDVFMEYNVKAENQSPEKLAKPNIDTGLGVDRIVYILNGEDSVYNVGSFKQAMNFIKNNISQEAYQTQQKSLRIICDHMRATTFILADNAEVSPAPVGAGYVLRRLIRRSLNHAHNINLPVEKLIEIPNIFIDYYLDEYPELQQNRQRVLNELKKEIEKFENTIILGKKEFEKVSFYCNTGVISGKTAFRLYDTFGFPLELTCELASEKGLKVDVEGYKNAFEEHQNKSRAGATMLFKGGLADTSDKSAQLHTATHLLLAGLKKILNPNIIQKGSNITPERLRFDFNFERKLTEEELKQVEQFVNDAINQNINIVCEELSLEQARESGASGIFENKYGNRVKVFTIGNISKEICGGPHAKNTQELGKFKIIKEESSSSGIRRIKAVLE